MAVSEQPEGFARLLGLLSRGNQRWASHTPVLMLAAARLYEEYSGHPAYRSLYDLGPAVGFLTVQATSLGLAIHQMGGFQIEKARTELRIPDEYLPVTAPALGYPGDPAILPDDLRARESATRERKKQTEFVFGAGWSDAPPWERD